ALEPDGVRRARREAGPAHDELSPDDDRADDDDGRRGGGLALADLDAHADAVGRVGRLGGGGRGGTCGEGERPGDREGGEQPAGGRRHAVNLFVRPGAGAARVPPNPTGRASSRDHLAILDARTEQASRYVHPLVRTRPPAPGSAPPPPPRGATGAEPDPGGAGAPARG